MGVAALVALAGFAGCSRGSNGGGRATLPVTEVGSRYQAVMGPANAALTAFVTEAVAYGGGSPAGIKAAAHSTEGTINDAGHRVVAIAAPEPIGRDIRDVMGSLTAVAQDLATLAQANGPEIETVIARTVADAGRESAADSLVSLAIKLATTPTTEPPATVPPPVTTTIPVTTTTVAKHTTTTRLRPRTTTTAPRATTTTRK